MNGKQLALLAAIISGAAISGYIVPTEAKQLIQTNDIADGAVTTSKIATGAVTINVVERSASATVSSGQVGTAQASCQPGEKVTGGGFNDPSFGDLKIWQNKKDATENAWHVAVYNPTGEQKGFSVYAECASISP